MEAKRELGRHGGDVGGVELRVACLPLAEKGGRLDLAQIGANARRATEDSSAIAYIGEPTPAASRFAETILEEAEIPQLQATSGSTAMAELISALNRSSGESANLRASVQKNLE